MIISWIQTGEKTFILSPVCKKQSKNLNRLATLQKMWNRRFCHSGRAKFRIQLITPDVDLSHRSLPQWIDSKPVQKWRNGKIPGMNVIEPAELECVSSIMFATKKEGLLLTFLNYRKLNCVTVHDANADPTKSLGLDALGGAGVFSKLDGSSEYLEIQTENKFKDETTLTLNPKVYRFLRMPFSLETSTTTFSYVWTSYCQLSAGSLGSCTLTTSPSS